MVKHLAIGNQPVRDERDTFCGSLEPEDTAGNWDGMDCEPCAEAHGNYVEALERRFE